MGNLSQHLPENLSAITRADGKSEARESTSTAITTPFQTTPRREPATLRESGEEISTLTRESPITPAVWREGIARIGANFGVNYIAKDARGNPTADHAKALTLLEELRRKGWTDGDFATALDPFLMTCKFPTWTIADFMTERPKVYPWSWYNERTPAERELIGAYALDGHTKPVFGWRHEVGDRLPVWVAPPQIRELAAAPEPMTPEVSAELALAKLAISQGLARDLNKDLTREQQANKHLRAAVDLLKLEVAEKNAEIERLKEEIEQLWREREEESAEVITNEAEGVE